MINMPTSGNIIKVINKTDELPVSLLWLSLGKVIAMCLRLKSEVCDLSSNYLALLKKNFFFNSSQP